MTAEEFTAAQERMGLSRRKFCARIGIGRRTGDEYALGRSAIPRVVELAIAAVEAGLDEPAAKKSSGAA